MARGKSKNSMSVDELIEMNGMEIEEAKLKLNSLQDERKELLVRKEKEELSNLVKTLELAGISYSEAAELIKTQARKQVEKETTMKDIKVKPVEVIV